MAPIQNVRRQPDLWRNIRVGGCHMTQLRNSLLIGASAAAWTLVGGSALAQNANQAETVIVTGTRVSGMTAADSGSSHYRLGL